MGALQLDRMSWPEVRAELSAGRDTVVMAFGATEQHGPHLPLATDALIGDHLAELVAERLGAFVAPTVRVGCSEHHLAFPGTLSVSEATFHRLVADLVRSLASGGFRRIVLLPTHGGNFRPLAEAIERLGPVEGVAVSALTDLGALLTIARLGAEEHGVPLAEGGLHAGEWETSMLEAIHPDLVHPERGEAGYTGDPQEAIGAIFAAGVHTIAPNGVIGDPSRASPEHGRRYWDEVLSVALAEIG
jgi:creatinine amidohydrolase/Fe(II)-dependent formamide hydrolase-like protein